jgi:hypothetical protein
LKEVIHVLRGGVHKEGYVEMDRTTPQKKSNAKKEGVPLRGKENH